MEWPFRVVEWPFRDTEYTFYDTERRFLLLVQIIYFIRVGDFNIKL